MKTYELDIDGRHYSVTVNGIGNGTASVTVNGKALTVEVESQATERPVRDDSAAKAVRQEENAAASPVKMGNGSGIILSPLPGVIINVDVKEGQTVRRGERIAVLEAMKMENDILAESDGTVRKIYISRGDSLLEGAKIALIEK